MFLINLFTLDAVFLDFSGIAGALAVLAGGAYGREHRC
jgi:hypothetical protein